MIADLIIPVRDELLVRVDPETERIGEIWKPDNSTRAAVVMAQVLAAGPDARFFRGGETVLLPQFGGSVLAVDGIAKGDQARLVPQGHVLALVTPEAPAGMALFESTAGADWLEAPPGHLLVERYEMPLKRGRIRIPESYRSNVRCHEATVLRIALGVDGYSPGDHVLLSSMVIGRSVAFGLRDERTLWLVTPGQIMARVRDLPEDAAVLNAGEHPMAGWRDAPVLSASVPEALIHDEGDPGGLR